MRLYKFADDYNNRGKAFSNIEKQTAISNFWEESKEKRESNPRDIGFGDNFFGEGGALSTGDVSKPPVASGYDVCYIMQSSGRFKYIDKSSGAMVLVHHGNRAALYLSESAIPSDDKGLYEKNSESVRRSISYILMKQLVSGFISPAIESMPSDIPEEEGAVPSAEEIVNDMSHTDEFNRVVSITSEITGPSIKPEVKETINGLFNTLLSDARLLRIVKYNPGFKKTYYDRWVTPGGYDFSSLVFGIASAVFSYNIKAVRATSATVAIPSMSEHEVPGVIREKINGFTNIESYDILVILNGITSELYNDVLFGTTQLGGDNVKYAVLDKDGEFVTVSNITNATIIAPREAPEKYVERGKYYLVFAAVNAGPSISHYMGSGIKPYILQVRNAQDVYSDFRLMPLSDKENNLGRYPFVLFDSGMKAVQLDSDVIDSVYKSYYSFEEARNAVISDDYAGQDVIFNDKEKMAYTGSGALHVVTKIKSPWKQNRDGKLKIISTTTEGGIRGISVLPRMIKGPDEDGNYVLSTFKTGRASSDILLTSERIDMDITVAKIVSVLGFGYVPLETGVGALKSEVLYGNIVEMQEYLIKNDDNSGVYLEELSGTFMAVLPYVEESFYIEIPKEFKKLVDTASNPYFSLTSALVDSGILNRQDTDRFNSLINSSLDNESGSGILAALNIIDKNSLSDKINPMKDLRNVFNSVEPPELASMNEEERDKYLVKEFKNSYFANYADGSSHRMLEYIEKASMISMDDFGFYVSQPVQFGQFNTKRLSGDLFAANMIEKSYDDYGAIYSFNIYSFERSGGHPLKIDTVRTRLAPGSDPQRFYAIGSLEEQAISDMPEYNISGKSPVVTRHRPETSKFNLGKYFDVYVFANNPLMMLLVRKLVDKYAYLFGIEKGGYSELLDNAYRNCYRVIYDVSKRVAGKNNVPRLAARIVEALLSMDASEKTGVILNIDGKRVELSLESIIPPIFGIADEDGEAVYADYASISDDPRYKDLLKASSKALASIAGHQLDVVEKEEKHEADIGFVETPNYIYENGEYIKGIKGTYISLNGVGGDVYGPMSPFKINTGEGIRYYLIDSLNAIRCSSKVLGIDSKDSYAGIISPDDIWMLKSTSIKQAIIAGSQGNTDVFAKLEEDEARLAELEGRLKEKERDLENNIGVSLEEYSSIDQEIQDIKNKIQSLSNNIKNDKRTVETIKIHNNGMTTLAYKHTSGGNNLFLFLKRPDSAGFPDDISKVKNEDNVEWWEDRLGNRINITTASRLDSVTSTWSDTFTEKAVNYNPSVESSVISVYNDIKDRSEGQTKYLPNNMYLLILSKAEPGMVITDDMLRGIAEALFLEDREGTLKRVIHDYLLNLKKNNNRNYKKIVYSAMKTAYSDEWSVESVADVICKFVYDNADILGSIIKFRENDDLLEVDFKQPSNSYMKFTTGTARSICKLFANLNPQYIIGDGMLPFLRALVKAAISHGLDVILNNRTLRDRLLYKFNGLYDFSSGDNEKFIVDMTELFMAVWLNMRIRKPELRKVYVGVREKDSVAYMTSAYKKANRFGIFDGDPLNVADSLFASEHIDEIAQAFLMDLVSSPVVANYVKRRQEDFANYAASSVVTADSIDSSMNDSIIKSTILGALGSFAYSIVDMFDREFSIIKDEYHNVLAEEYMDDLIDERRRVLNAINSGEPISETPVKDKVIGAREANITKAFHRAFERYKTKFDGFYSQSGNSESIAAVSGIGTVWASDADSAFIMNLLQCLFRDQNFAFLLASTNKNPQGMSSVIKILKSVLKNHPKYSKVVDQFSDSDLFQYARAIYVHMLSDSVLHEPGKSYLSPSYGGESLRGYMKDLIDEGEFESLAGLDSDSLYVVRRKDKKRIRMNVMSVGISGQIQSYKDMKTLLVSLPEPEIGSVVALEKPYNGNSFFIYSGLSESSGKDTIVPVWDPVKIINGRAVFDTGLFNDIDIGFGGKTWDGEFKHVLGIMDPYYNSISYVPIADIIKSKVEDDDSLKRENIHYDTRLAAKLSEISSVVSNFRASFHGVTADADIHNSFADVNSIAKGEAGNVSNVLVRTVDALVHLFAEKKIVYKKSRDMDKLLEELKEELRKGPVTIVKANGKDMKVEIPSALIDALTTKTIKDLANRLRKVRDFETQYRDGLVIMETELAKGLHFVANKLGLRISSKLGVDSESIPFTNSETMSAYDKVYEHLRFIWDALPTSTKKAIARDGLGQSELSEAMSDVTNDDYAMRDWIDLMLSREARGGLDVVKSLSSSWSSMAEKVSKAMHLYSTEKISKSKAGELIDNPESISHLDIAHGSLSIINGLNQYERRRVITPALISSSVLGIMRSVVDEARKLWKEIEKKENDLRDKVPSLAESIIDSLRHAKYPYELPEDIKNKINSIPDNKTRIYVSNALSLFSGEIDYSGIWNGPSLREIKTTLHDDDGFIKTLDLLLEKYPDDVNYIKSKLREKFGDDWNTELDNAAARMSVKVPESSKIFTVVGAHFSPEFISISNKDVVDNNVFGIRNKVASAHTALWDLRARMNKELKNNEFDEKTIRDINKFYSTELNRRLEDAARSLSSKNMKIDADALIKSIENKQNFAKVLEDDVDNRVLGSGYLRGLFEEVIAPAAAIAMKGKETRSNKLIWSVLNTIKDNVDVAFEKIDNMINSGLSDAVGLGKFKRYIDSVKKELSSPKFANWVIDNVTKPIGEEDSKTTKTIFTNSEGVLGTKDERLRVLFSRWVSRDNVKMIFNSLKDLKSSDAEAYKKETDEMRATIYAGLLSRSKELSNEQISKLYNIILKFINDDLKSLNEVENLNGSIDAPPIGIEVVISDARPGVAKKVLSAEEAMSKRHIRYADGGTVMSTENYNRFLEMRGTLVARYRASTGVYCAIKGGPDGNYTVSGIPDEMVFMSSSVSKVNPLVIVDMERIVNFYNSHSDADPISVKDLTVQWLNANMSEFNKMMSGVSESEREDIRKIFDRLLSPHQINNENRATIYDLIDNGQVTPKMLSGALYNYLKEVGLPNEQVIKLVKRAAKRDYGAYKITQAGRKAVVYDRESKSYKSIPENEMSKGAWHRGCVVKVNDDIDRKWMRAELESNIDNITYNQEEIISDLASEEVKRYNAQVLKSINDGTSIVSQVNDGCREWLMVIYKSLNSKKDELSLAMANYMKRTCLDVIDFHPVRITGSGTRGFLLFSGDGIPFVGDDSKTRLFSMEDLWSLFGAAKERKVGKSALVRRVINQDNLNKLLDSMKAGAVRLGAPYYFGSDIYKYTEQNTNGIIREYRFSIDNKSGDVKLHPVIVASGVATSGSNTTLTDINTIESSSSKRGKKRRIKPFDRFRNVNGLKLEVIRDGETIFRTFVTSLAGDTVVFAQQYDSEANPIEIKSGDKYRLTYPFSIERSSYVPLASSETGAGKYRVSVSAGDLMAMVKSLSEEGMLSRKELLRKYYSAVQRVIGSISHSKFFGGLRKRMKQMKREEKNRMERREISKRIGDYLFSLGEMFKDEYSIVDNTSRVLTDKLFTERGSNILARLVIKREGTEAGFGEVLYDLYRKQIIGENVTAAFLSSYTGENFERMIDDYNRLELRSNIVASSTSKDKFRHDNMVKEWTKIFRDRLKVADIESIKSRIAREKAERDKLNKVISQMESLKKKKASLGKEKTDMPVSSFNISLVNARALVHQHEEEIDRWNRYLEWARNYSKAIREKNNNPKLLEEIESKMESIALSFAPLTSKDVLRMVKNRNRLGEEMHPERIISKDEFKSAAKARIYYNAVKNLAMKDFSSLMNMPFIPVPGNNALRKKQRGVTVASDNMKEIISETRSKANIHSKIYDYYSLGTLWVMMMRNKNGDISAKDSARAKELYKEFLMEEARGIADWYNSVFGKKLKVHGISKASAKKISTVSSTGPLEVNDKVLSRNADRIVKAIVSGEPIGDITFVLGHSAVNYLFPLQNKMLLKELLRDDAVSCADIKIDENTMKSMGVTADYMESAKQYINRSLYYELFLKHDLADRNLIGTAQIISKTGPGELYRTMFNGRFGEENLSDELEIDLADPLFWPDSGNKTEGNNGPFTEAGIDRFSKLLFARDFNKVRPLRLWGVDMEPLIIGTFDVEPTIEVRESDMIPVTTFDTNTTTGYISDDMQQAQGTLPWDWEENSSVGPSVVEPGVRAATLKLTRKITAEEIRKQELILKLALFEGAHFGSRLFRGSDSKMSKIKKEWIDIINNLGELDDMDPKVRDSLGKTLFDDFVAFIFSEANIHKTMDDLRALLNNLNQIETTREVFSDIDIPSGFINRVLGYDSPLLDKMKEIIELYHDDSFRNYMRHIVDEAFTSDLATPMDSNYENNEGEESPAGSILSRNLAGM